MASKKMKITVSCGIYKTKYHNGSYYLLFRVRKSRFHVNI